MSRSSLSPQSLARCLHTTDATRRAEEQTRALTLALQTSPSPSRERRLSRSGVGLWPGASVKEVSCVCQVSCASEFPKRRRKKSKYLKSLESGTVRTIYGTCKKRPQTSVAENNNRLICLGSCALGIQAGVSPGGLLLCGLLARVSHSETLNHVWPGPEGPWKLHHMPGASVMRPLSPLVSVGFLTARRSRGVSYGRWFPRRDVQHVKAEAASLEAQPQEVTQHNCSLHIIQTSHKGSPDSEGGAVA